MGMTDVRARDMTTRQQMSNVTVWKQYTMEYETMTCNGKAIRKCWIYRGSECRVVNRGETIIVWSDPRGLQTKHEAYYALCIPIAYLAINYTIYSTLQWLCLSAIHMLCYCAMLHLLQNVHNGQAK
jgi:hypothetical protein